MKIASSNTLAGVTTAVIRVNLNPLNAVRKWIRDLLHLLAADCSKMA